MSSYTPPTPFHSAAVLGRRFLPADAMGVTAFRVGEVAQAATKGTLMNLAYQMMKGDGIDVKKLITHGAIGTGSVTWFLDNYGMPLLVGSFLEQPTS